MRLREKLVIAAPLLAGLGTVLKTVVDAGGRIPEGRTGWATFGGGVGLGIGLGALAGVLWATHTAKPARAKAARDLVEDLHKRWFPDSHGALDRDYRVSLFVPVPDGANPTKWDCVARTTTDQKPASWDHVLDRQRLPRAGAVVYAAVQQTGLDVLGVPAGKRNDVQEATRYRRDGRITEELQMKRSWPWASLMVRLARARNGTIACVLVVERESGEPIEVLGRKLRIVETGDNGDTIHDVCGWELQLAADVWIAARGDE